MQTGFSIWEWMKRITAFLKIEREGMKMNILDYIDSLIEQGYSEEDAERCADCLYSDYWESED